MRVPKEHHKFILGKNGNKLKAIELSTATKIMTPRSEENSELIKITGTKEGIDKAKHEIQLISDEQVRHVVQSGKCIRLLFCISSPVLNVTFSFYFNSTWMRKFVFSISHIYHVFQCIIPMYHIKVLESCRFVLLYNTLS